MVSSNIDPENNYGYRKDKDGLLLPCPHLDLLQCEALQHVACVCGLLAGARYQGISYYYCLPAKGDSYSDVMKLQKTM